MFADHDAGRGLMLAALPPLPITDVIPALQQHLCSTTTLLLQAPPGAGKTTLVPLALLDEPWLQGQKILLLEPRRLAARAAATRMAELLGEPVGATVGYRIRFEQKISAKTRIEVLTEGILTRRLQRDPELVGVGLVIFDEQHERSLHTDLALALCREAQQALREELRLLVMSATLDGAALARLLHAPIVTSSGRSYPVTVHYLAHDPSGPLPATVTRTVLTALQAQAGDVLVFLPGAAEIRQTRDLLAAEPDCRDLRLLPLYGDLPQAEQRRALQPDPDGRRKIVLATPIAETSLTIEGVTIVVDSGLARTPRFDPNSGLTRMVTVRIAADAAEQRAGRAGRLGPGVCYRLWSAATQRSLLPHRAPEILEADLAPLALELAQWGVTDVNSLTWQDLPPAGALAQAQALLTDLDALDAQGRITAAGQALAGLPLHPRLAHMLLCGAERGLAELACAMAALLEERDLLRRDSEAGSDLALRVEALRAYREQGAAGARRWGADPAACARCVQAAQQWYGLLQPVVRTTEPEREAVGLLLALAYPERIARRRADSPDRYQLANGRGARLAAHDPLQGTDWLVAAQLDAGQSEGRIYLAAAVQPDDLAQVLTAHIRAVAEIRWDSRSQAVSAVREQRLGALVLDSRPLTQPDPQALRNAMLDGVRQLGLAALPWTEAARAWQARLLSLRHWSPSDDWPDLSDDWLAAHLTDWLEPYLDGCSRREHLARLDLLAIVQNRLDWTRQRQLDEAAPTHLAVPSGSRIRLHYTPGQPPVLAVRLQEVFGWTDTPRINHGRVPVLLHLLSPAQRPIQVTQDLRGFWQRTYAEVKKELKGRYPKHYWPDDPWNAIPTRRVRPPAV